MATANGGLGIWREETGASAKNSTSWADFNFDTEVEADGDFAQSGGSSETDFEMPSGHVLVIQNHGYIGNAGSDRVALYTGLELDGADLIYGRGSGYIRYVNGTQHKQTTPSSAAILNVASTDDILTSRYKRFDTNSGATVLDIARGSSIQCVKLDDHRGYFRATRSTAKNTAGIVTGITTSIATLNASGSWDEVDWDSPDEETGNFSLTGGAGTSEIIVPPWRILLTYGVQFHLTSGTTRRNGVVRVQARDGGGGSWVTQANTLASGYCRGSNAIDYGYASSMVLLNLEAMSDPRIRIQFIEECESGSRLLEMVEAYITMTDLPPGADYIDITTDAAETTFVNTLTTTTFDTTATEIDTNSFGYASGQVIEMKLASRYLFFSQFGTERTLSNSNRQEPGFRWKLGTTYPRRGYFSEFSRGDQGTDSTWFGGSGGGILHDSAGDPVNDLLQLYHTCHTTATARDMQAPIGYISIQGVNLTTAFNFHSSDTVTDTVTAAKAALIGSIVGLLTSACSPTDSTRGGLVVEDTVYTRDIARVDNYAPLYDVKPDNLVYAFPDPREEKIIVPTGMDLERSVSFGWVPEGVDLDDVLIGDWKAVDEDVTDTSDVSEYIWALGHKNSFFEPDWFRLTFSSIPNNYPEVISFTLRVRLFWDADVGAGPFDLELTTAWDTGSVVDSITLDDGVGYDQDILEFEHTGLSMTALDVNSIDLKVNLPAVDGIWPFPGSLQLHAIDILFPAISNEKDIDEENFDGKPAPSTDFTGGKDSSDPGWSEDDGPGPVFDPS